MKLIILIFFLSFLNLQNAFSQLYNKGGIIYIQPTAKVYADTDICNTDAGIITNEGIITTTENLKNTTSSTLQGNGTYKIYKDWTNTANYQADNSTVEFSSTFASQIASGGDDFYTIRINKLPNTNTSLIEDASVSNQLNFVSTNNQLFLGNHELTLQNTATINGFNETNYVVTDGTGSLNKENLNYIRFVYPVGANNSTYNPIGLAEYGIVDRIGVRCLQDALSQGLTGNPKTNQFVATSWHITEAIAGGTDIDMRVHWNASDELPIFDRTDCSVVQYRIDDWEAIDIIDATMGTDPYFMDAFFISEVGVFSVSNIIALPLELLSFEVIKNKDNHALLLWRTESEVNIQHFDLQKSTDTKNWTNIGKVQAKGQVSTTHYEFIDKDLQTEQATGQVFYYRLKIIENDASFTYSEIKSIHINQKNEWMTIYPNPTESGIYIQILATLGDETLLLKLYDGIGKVILTRNFTAELNDSFWAFPDLPTGVYQLELSSNENIVQVEQLVIK